MNELHTLTSLISIALLMILLFWLFPQYRTDLFRQKMFKLRDSLFDEALNGKISFNDPAYNMLRNAMNGFIRFGHQLNIWQALLFTLIIKNNKQIDHPFTREFDKNTKQCTDNQRQIYLSYYFKMNLYILEHLILSSVILVSLIVPAVFLFLAKKHIEKFASLLRAQLDKLNTVALTTGKA
ncbi:hypothetical protein [Nitrosomonas sp. Nm166]|uniref:hypothetical protein n=1 Tax=Nitrosomonas sp. Nm166 TaxID=1881054 RepID=UPI0008F3C7D8|nr:hypothetical protein [Nitrosomonas sp. Nm166]SFF13758.1 hypothetical protein SAMN05428977_105421 [Nitrosomonas sp. Nm166]